MDISDKILSDPVNRLIFSESSAETYIVGGYLRNLLSGISSTDRDFVTEGSAEKLARKTSLMLNGTYVELKKHTAFRVVIKKDIVLDFTELDGLITENLLKRDFTVNAIAWSRSSGIISPSGFIDDIKKKIIRSIREENLQNDPLRVLRAYRLGAQLNYEIDRITRVQLKKNGPLLTKVSDERITEEFIQIINSKICLLYLELAYKDKVIHHVVGRRQSELKKSLQYLNNLDLYNKNKITLKFHRVKRILDRPFSQNFTLRGLIILSVLISTPNTSNLRLKLSNNNIRIVNMICNLINLKYNRFTKRRIFDIYYSSENMVEEAAAVLTVIYRSRDNRFFKEADRYFNVNNNLIADGEDIKRWTGLKGGSEIGVIKRQILELQYRGIIEKRAEALRYIKANLT